MISVEVPGKLYIAGEYAVLEPGGAAVLVAVDRFVTVSARPAADRTVTSAHTGGRPVGPAALPYVGAAVDVVSRYAAETGQPMSGFALDIRSGLEAVDGRKYGLGSSGAVTVGVVRALCGLFSVPVSALDVVRLALLAVFSVDPRCSGGDVAASALGGWVAYRSPDRAALAGWTSVAETLSRPWPLLAASAVPAPRGLELLVGWSGRPATSSSLVARVRPSLAGFRADSDAVVSRLVTALTEGDDAGVASAVDAAGALLRKLSPEIEVEELARLRAGAEAAGAVAKSSGAGGGDCGIALARPSAAVRVRRAWRAAGITPLDLRVQEVR